MCSAWSVPAVAWLKSLPVPHAEDFFQQVFLMSAFPVFRAFYPWLIALGLSVVPSEPRPLEKSREREIESFAHVRGV